MYCFLSLYFISICSDIYLFILSTSLVIEVSLDDLLIGDNEVLKSSNIIVYWPVGPFMSSIISFMKFKMYLQSLYLLDELLEYIEFLFF